MLAALLMRCMQKRRMLKREVEEHNQNLECCRTCLARDELKPIFIDYTDSQPISMMQLSQYLQIASGLKIAKDDGLPQVICTNCINLMNGAIKFRNLCKKTEKTLLSMNLNNKATVTAKPLVKFCKTKVKLNKVKKKVKKKKKKVAITSLEDQFDGDNGFNSQDNNDEPSDNNTVYSKKDTNAIYNNELNNKIMLKRKLMPVPFSLKCKICERVMKNKHTYLRHMVVHTGEYPFMCEQCGKGLMAYTHLVTHMKANHGWERTDKCSYCGYLALNKSILQIHERTHTGEKPFICDHCGTGFHRRANLLQHLPIHSSIKTAQCSLCPSSFKSIRFLRTHHNKKHKQVKYTYVCDICKNYFKTCGNVRLHMTRIHSVPREDQGPVTRVLISDTYINRAI